MGKERYNFPTPNPFVEDDMDKNGVASVARRYHRWKLGVDTDLIVHCEHDGVMTGAEAGFSVRGRHCHRAEEQQLQVGPLDLLCFAGRIRVPQAWLRVLVPRERLLMPRHPGRPAVQAQCVCQSDQPERGERLAHVCCVIDTCMKLEEGKYLSLRDPSKQVVRVYSLPDSTFSWGEDDEEEEEEEEET
ncbi:hypothetical protein EI555_014778 [Monodon monoceros]|uniref:Uncharacterized protein n=1 Tax=Monodon monoceros TaxID=40151 RepID=A0A4V5PAU9_MONMO|nr:hypothetical protein EI555_014778 [Monodon monoceros]